MLYLCLAWAFLGRLYINVLKNQPLFYEYLAINIELPLKGQVYISLEDEYNLNLWSDFLQIAFLF